MGYYNVNLLLPAAKEGQQPWKWNDDMNDMWRARAGMITAYLLEEVGINRHSLDLDSVERIELEDFAKTRFL